MRWWANPRQAARPVAHKGQQIDLQPAHRAADDVPRASRRAAPHRQREPIHPRTRARPRPPEAGERGRGRLEVARLRGRRRAPSLDRWTHDLGAREHAAPLLERGQRGRTLDSVLPAGAGHRLLLRDAVRAGAAEQAGREGMPPPLQLAEMVREFGEEIQPVSPPWPLLRMLSAVLAPIARLRGYRARLEA